MTVDMGVMIEGLWWITVIKGFVPLLRMICRWKPLLLQHEAVTLKLPSHHPIRYLVCHSAKSSCSNLHLLAAKSHPFSLKSTVLIGLLTIVQKIRLDGVYYKRIPEPAGTYRNPMTNCIQIAGTYKKQCLKCLWGTIRQTIQCTHLLFIFFFLSLCSSDWLHFFRSPLLPVSLSMRTQYNHFSSGFIWWL